MHTLNPLFPKNNHRFDISLHSSLKVVVKDRRSRFESKVLGQALLPVEAIPGTDPVYMWLPLAHMDKKTGPMAWVKVGLCA